MTHIRTPNSLLLKSAILLRLSAYLGISMDLTDYQIDTVEKFLSCSDLKQGFGIAIQGIYAGKLSIII